MWLQLRFMFPEVWRERSSVLLVRWPWMELWEEDRSAVSKEPHQLQRTVTQPPIKYNMGLERLVGSLLPGISSQTKLPLLSTHYLLHRAPDTSWIQTHGFTPDRSSNNNNPISSTYVFVSKPASFFHLFSR